MRPGRAIHPDIGKRVEALDWRAIETALEERGAAATGQVLGRGQCRELAGLYDDDTQFRSRVVMARHGFGSGEYKYLAYPLPDVVASLRAALYARLAPIANRWQARMGRAERYPGTLPEFLDACHGAGQTKPTPLLLTYEAGDYNCLHQDLYGAMAFPLQVVVLLSEPGTDFEGGEFVVVEQRPRMQSRAEVVVPGLGEAVIFAVNERPVAGRRGDYRVKMRHGVSRLHKGRRQTLGVIFHDAA